MMGIGIGFGIVIRITDELGKTRAERYKENRPGRDGRKTIVSGGMREALQPIAL